MGIFDIIARQESITRQNLATKKSEGSKNKSPLFLPKPLEKESIVVQPVADRHEKLNFAPLRTAENLENFRVAWPWLQEHLSTLLDFGWSRVALFQRGQLRFPLGAWGIAWLDVWRKPNLSVTIGKDGQIEFTFLSGIRLVKQTASPPFVGKRPSRSEANRLPHHKPTPVLQTGFKAT